jgi:trigger factor
LREFSATRRAARLGARRILKGNTLTPTELETTTSAEQPEAHTHEHTHDHEHDHSHDELAPGLHTHSHNHGPALNPELAREISVEVPADEVSKAFRTVTKRYQKLARIPGFRAGKVPESLIKKRFAKEVRQEVLESLVSERFKAAIDEQKIKPVSQPQLVDMQLIDGQPLTFKAAFEVMPEIDIAGYDSVKVEKPDTALTDDEFEAELARVLDSNAVVEPVEEERELAEGDWAEIEFKGKIKPLAEVVTEAGVESAEPEAPPITGDDVLVEIGGKNTLPAFNDALRGAKVGQELEFEVAYPTEFGERKLAGQTVAYDVTVKAIKKKTFPERNAEFASQLGAFESWEEFETKLREMASDRKATALENAAKDKLVGELIQRFQFPVPESFVQQQIEARLDRGLRALAQQGMSTDDMRKLDFVRLREAQREQAINEVKASMILDRVAEAEGVEVSDKELDDEILMLSYQGREPYETLRARLEGDGGLDRIREQMKREKTGNLLYAKLSS